MMDVGQLVQIVCTDRRDAAKVGWGGVGFGFCAWARWGSPARERNLTEIFLDWLHITARALHAALHAARTIARPLRVPVHLVFIICQVRGLEPSVPSASYPHVIRTLPSHPASSLARIVLT